MALCKNDFLIKPVTPKKPWIKPNKLIEKVYFDDCSGNETRMKTEKKNLT